MCILCHSCSLWTHKRCQIIIITSEFSSPKLLSSVNTFSSLVLPLLSFIVRRRDIDIRDLYIFLIYRAPDSFLLPWHSLVTAFTLWFLWRLKTQNIEQTAKSKPKPLILTIINHRRVCVSELCAALISRLCPSGRNLVLFVSSGAPSTLPELHK